MTAADTKRQKGDRWGLVSIDLDTGEQCRVQICGWEDSTFPYRRQAEEYARDYNLLSAQYHWNRRYETRYAGPGLRYHWWTLPTTDHQKGRIIDSQ
jgi:hypothetical protein